MPTTPGCAASQRAKAVNSLSSIEKSDRNGTAIAGMSPWKFVIVGIVAFLSGGLSERRWRDAGTRGLDGARELGCGRHHRFAGCGIEGLERHGEGWSRDRERRQRHAIGIEHGRSQHTQPGDVLLVRQRKAAAPDMIQPR